MHSKHKAFISIFAIFFSAIIVSVLIAVFMLLIRQIQLLTIDSSSFQAYYIADSATECAVAKEKIAAQKAYLESASGTPTFIWNTTVFSPDRWMELKDSGCASPGDIDLSQPIAIDNTWVTEAKLSMPTNDMQFCGLIKVVRNSGDYNSPNYIIATGRSIDCQDTSNLRAVERGINVQY